MNSRPVFLEKINNKGMGLIEWIIIIVLAILIIAGLLRLL